MPSQQREAITHEVDVAVVLDSNASFGATCLKGPLEAIFRALSAPAPHTAPLSIQNHSSVQEFPAGPLKDKSPSRRALVPHKAGVGRTHRDSCSTGRESKNQHIV